MWGTHFKSICCRIYNVSILVLVDFALRQDSIQKYREWTKVSILVLVDFALRPLRSHLITHGKRSFNPCFSGFRIATMFFPAAHIFHFSFNPCFSGFRIATTSFVYSFDCPSCFNPCFSGFRIATSQWKFINMNKVMFQSLF